MSLLLCRHRSNRHYNGVTRKGRSTSTRSAQALVSWYSSVQVKNPSIRRILQRCATRRLRRIGQEGRISAKLVKLESEFVLSENHSTERDLPSANAEVDINKSSNTTMKTKAIEDSARAQLPMNSKARKEFKKKATNRMKELQKQRSKKWFTGGTQCPGGHKCVLNNE